MQNRLLVKSLLLFLITICLSITLNEVESKQADGRNNQFQFGEREKRGTAKPGFFRTLFSVVYDQWADTKNTIGKVNRMINANFLPENAPVTQPTTPDPNLNVSTTMAPYKIKRSEFNRILRRNLRGLVRLFNIELQDALQQSKYNYADFRRNVSKEISKFL